jgi:glycosyltransferase involved in cell wall biosynthesis
MRKVYTLHDYLPHSGEWKATPLILNNIYTRLDYQFIQHYYFLSASFSDFFKVPPQRVHTVYCGPLDVYKSFINGEVNEEPATILFFGRISRYKGLDYLIQAFSEVKKIIPKAKLVVAGKGDFWFKPENDGTYEVYNRHISNEELVNLIQRATIIVTPYTDATHSAVIMTAYAFNKPVVASSVGGIPEVVTDNVTGTLVPARNTRALAEAISDLLLNREKRARIKKNIEKECFTGKLSWDNVAKKTIEVYQRAIDSYKV